jgi:hypothetical protein
MKANLVRVLKTTDSQVREREGGREGQRRESGSIRNALP